MKSIIHKTGAAIKIVQAEKYLGGEEVKSFVWSVEFPDGRYGISGRAWTEKEAIEAANSACDNADNEEGGDGSS